MAASVRAVTAQDDGADLANGHSTKLTAREQADYEAGLDSLIRMIGKAKPGLEEAVFRNAVSEAAGYVRRGLSKQIVVDRLNEVRSVGLNLDAEDLIDDHVPAITTAATGAATDYIVRQQVPYGQNRLKPILWSDLHKLPMRQALIEGLLDCTALSVMFGPSGCGKTFFALDLAAHVAIERPWRGRAVLQGAAVYVAPEGGYGILERLTAFSCKYEIDPKDVPLYVVPDPIDLCNSETDIDLLLGHLGNLPKDQPLRLLIIDTVSRALAGGNENSSDHMGTLIKRCDSLRASTGAHVMLLHHTGKDQSLGARGHSSLKAAVDTEIEMKWDKEGQSGLATVTKQRDSRTEGAFAFTLAEVDVDLPENGSPVTSCAVVPIEEESGRASKVPPLPAAARTVLNALTKAIKEVGEPAPASKDIPSDAKVVPENRFREYAYKEGISKKGAGERAQQVAFQRALGFLVPNWIGRSGDLFWLNAFQHGGEHTNTL
jgi:AAA domain